MVMDIDEEDSMAMLGLRRCSTVSDESSDDRVVLHSSGLAKEDELEKLDAWDTCRAL